MSGMTAPASDRHGEEVETLKTTLVDQVASFLLSSAIMIGLAVLLLGALYFISTLKPRPKTIVVEEERIAGRGENAAGFERDLEPPAAEEVEQLSEPAIEQTLQSITEAVSSLSTTLDSIATDSSGTGKGDSRPPGPEGEGDDIIPRYERWELRFSARDSKSYAAQLDYFDIELAAIGGGHTQVDYVKQLAKNPVKWSGKGEEEKRLYFMNRREGPLLKYERDLLAKGGVNVSGRLVLKLIPKTLEDELAVLEKQNAIQLRGAAVTAKEYAKTIFECQPGASNGYQWVVVEQRFRTPRGR